MIRLDRARPFGYTLTDTRTGESLLVQVDYDYPSVASTFGWYIGSVEEPLPHGYSLPCEHGGTDGTVDCHDCGMTAADFIAAAVDYLDSQDGATADDPGYFR